MAKMESTQLGGDCNPHIMPAAIRVLPCQVVYFDLNLGWPVTDKCFPPQESGLHSALSGSFVGKA
jgi:hypothetical protein